MDILQTIQQIGAYAGFAAVIGLAVLAALYFSQARDMRRLRDEGVRAAPAQPLPPPPPGQAAQRLQSQRGSADVPAPGAAAAASAATAVQPRPATALRSPPPQAGAPPRPPARPPQRPPLGPQRARPQREPWYRSLEPRFMVLIVAGVLVVGAALIFGVAGLGGGAEEAPEPFRVVPTEPGQDDGTEQVDPTQVTVAVLNGTAVPGLAASIGDTVEAAGFRRGNIDNAPEQVANESAVLYAPGNEAAARLVSKELDISQVGQVDAGTQAQAGNAEVVVVVGPDQAP